MNLNRPNESNFYPKKLTRMELYQLGIPEDNFHIVNSLEDLKKSPPNMVIAECKTSVNYVQNKFRPQSLIKKQRYVMGAGIYMQLHYDNRTNTEILKPSQMQFKKIYKPYIGQSLENKTLLVFRTGGIGDLLFIQPNLIYLKEKYPSCTIKFACGPQYQDMVKEWECIDKVLDLPFFLNELFTSDYHCVFEGVIERCKESEKINAYHLFTKWMNLNLPDELLIPKQKPNEEAIIRNKQILKELNTEENNFIVLQIRASSPIRTPNLTFWKNLIDQLTDKGHNILITDSPHKSPDIDNFILTLKNKDKVKNFSQYSKTIADSIAITSLSKLVIATDSALNHISASLGIKTFGIFGAFLGELRLSTYPKNIRDWVNAEKNCAPCFQHGIYPCKNSISGYPTCYNNIDINLCVEKIERLLNNNV